MKIEKIMDGIAGGSVHGIAQILTCHPFDTIKVYLQTTGKYNMGIRHLYRGMGYPLIATVPTVAIQFGTESGFQQLVKKSEDEFTWSDGFISGGLTGLAAAPIISMMELYRIRRQTFTKSTKFRMNLGLGCTIAREIPAVSTYFGVYRYMFNQLKDLDLKSRSFIAGGLAGGSSWLINYPVDVIKTRIQSGECKTVREAYSKGTLWKGVGICTFRGTLANAFGFLALEMYKKYSQ